MLADGTPQRPLSDGEIGRVVAEAVATGAEAYAVCFLFSYLAPGHEEGWDGPWRRRRQTPSCPCPARCSPSFANTNGCRPRFSTPTWRRHGPLPEPPGHRVGLDPACRRRGDKPVERRAHVPGQGTALSHPHRPVGPAAGVLGAIEVARRAGRSDVVTFDMGGTSADVAMVRDLEPSYSFSRVIGGYPVRLPSVDISTVGAGGAPSPGSTATIS